MRHIVRGREPGCLADTRREAERVTQEAQRDCLASTDWSLIETTCKDSIRAKLCEDQGGLCAYCMRRIQPVGYRQTTAANGSKIEHLAARSEAPNQMFDWENLAAVCGGESPTRTCDALRGNAPLPINPYRRPPDVDAIFSYTRAGEIHSKDKLGCEAIILLNLNAPSLVGNRKSALDALRRAIRKDDRVGEIQRLYDRAATPNQQGQLEPHVGAVLDYLRKKLRSKGVPVLAGH